MRTDEGARRALAELGNASPTDGEVTAFVARNSLDAGTERVLRLLPPPLLRQVTERDCRECKAPSQVVMARVRRLDIPQEQKQILLAASEW
eukprot:gene44923-21312_t